jgi:hypothetical protein
MMEGGLALDLTFVKNIAEGKLQSNDRMNRFRLRADPRNRENRLDIDK